MKERTILHSDMNNFYASVEAREHPELRGKPIAVAGDVEKRHGIVLAKSYEAKKYGVQTGDPLWLAERKCPEIIFTPPHYDRYIKYSQQAQEIYYQYTDQVESFGLDECWLDVTGSIGLFGQGKVIADELRNKIYRELGLTVSIGVSFNKVLAKLGSDLKKPDATTVIDLVNFRKIVWPLPASDLLYVGKATMEKLKKYGIQTIGDLAKSDVRFMRALLGKNGEMLWNFANGIDLSEVSSYRSSRLIRTIGNSTTTPRDLVSDKDVKIILYILAESVAERLRAANFLCKGVQISIRDNTLFSYERQGRLKEPSRISAELFRQAFRQYTLNRPQNPVRSLGLRAINLTVQETTQLSLYQSAAKRQQAEFLEETIDNVRRKYGHYAIQRAIMLTDPELSNLDPVVEHTIYPEAFLSKR